MKERYLLEEEVGENGFSLITDYDGNDEHVFDVNIKSGDILPVLPLRNMVLFPGVFLPITVGRKASLKLVREAEKKHKDIAVICQRSAHTEDPKLEDLHNVGTVGRIVRVLEMPDQTTTVILQGMKRLRLKEIVDTHPYLKGEVELLEEDIRKSRRYIRRKKFHRAVVAIAFCALIAVLVVFLFFVILELKEGI